MEDALSEPHHLSGSLKENQEKLMESMKNFIGINALVTRCYWKALGGELQGESFLEECMVLKKSMAKIKESTCT